MPSRMRRDHGDEDLSVFEYEFKPRSLRRCINGVFRSDNNNTTDVCIKGPRTRTRPVETTPEIELKRDRIRQEVGAFQSCLCSIHSLGDKCRFNLSVVQDNSTILETCLEGEDMEYPLYHIPSNKNFSCILRGNNNRRNHVAVCRRVHPQITPPTSKETRFQNIVNCVSDSLKDISCPVTTTAPPLLTTTAATPANIKVAMLVMALLISLLLGVLGTWLGIFCWRRRRKKRKNNRPLSPLMTRPEHASQPNLYDSEYGEDHIYDIVKSDDSPSQPVPDLLSRVPSLPPMGNRTPKSKIDMDFDSGKAAFNKPEDYEPLLRNQTSPDKDNTDPKTPVPANDPPDYLPLLPDRNSREIPQPVKRVHPYDSINESEVEIEACDESITTPKLIDSPKSTQKAVGNEYFILEPTSLKPRDKADDISKQDAKTPEKIKDSDIEAMELKSPNDSGFVVSPDADNQKDELPENSDPDNDSDGYEIPVPEKPTFDIASSFTSKGPRNVNDDVVDV